jgi:hypothetical protein
MTRDDRSWARTSNARTLTGGWPAKRASLVNDAAHQGVETPIGSSLAETWTRSTRLALAITSDRQARQGRSR